MLNFIVPYMMTIKNIHSFIYLKLVLKTFLFLHIKKYADFFCNECFCNVVFIL